MKDQNKKVTPADTKLKVAIKEQFLVPFDLDEFYNNCEQERQQEEMKFKENSKIERGYLTREYRI